MKKDSLSKKILYWYDNNKRKLPWRSNLSKKQKQYFIIVSEFMLQQTQVKTVIPYFNNFVRLIPNLEKLAKVNNKRLMKCWQGLGYYSRARNLKKTAQIILKKHKGEIPNNFEDLKALPGIGKYIVIFGLVLFAFSTIIGWSYYGEKCAEFLFGEKIILYYRSYYYQ